MGWRPIIVLLRVLCPKARRWAGLPAMRAFQSLACDAASGARERLPSSSFGPLPASLPRPVVGAARVLPGWLAVGIDDRGRVSNWPKGFMDDDVREARRLLDAMYGPEPESSDGEGGNGA